ncbi:MAG TPA: hypothetical protein VGY66_19160 [Gemmataceae bacterium]|jgi:hypothetical protein|nr:hypothetical protein [Gemmataceae bacterium]
MTPGFFMRTAIGRIVAMRFPSRRTFWLSAGTSIVAIVACGWFLVPRSRINQENYDRIQWGMPREEVVAILGNPDEKNPLPPGPTGPVDFCMWFNGRTQVLVGFRNNKVSSKYLDCDWESAKRNAKRWLTKLGF